MVLERMDNMIARVFRFWLAGSTAPPLYPYLANHRTGECHLGCLIKFEKEHERIRLLDFAL